MGGEPQRGKQRLRQQRKQANSVSWYHFYLHISHEVTKSMTKLINQLCDEIQLAECLLREDVAI